MDISVSDIWWPLFSVLVHTVTDKPGKLTPKMLFTAYIGKAPKDMEKLHLERCAAFGTGRGKDKEFVSRLVHELVQQGVLAETTRSYAHGSHAYFVVRIVCCWRRMPFAPDGFWCCCREDPMLRHWRAGQSPSCFRVE